MFEVIGILFFDFTGPEVPESFGYEADPDSLPDPEFAGMAIPEIHDVLDEYSREAWEWYEAQRDLYQDWR